MKIRNEYMQADAKGKIQIERRYGRRTVQRVIEESFTNEYLEDSAKKCPHCKAWIQVNDMRLLNSKITILVPDVLGIWYFLRYIC